MRVNQDVATGHGGLPGIAIVFVLEIGMSGLSVSIIPRNVPPECSSITIAAIREEISHDQNIAR